jgi:hypothetical protein
MFLGERLGSMIEHARGRMKHANPSPVLVGTALGGLFFLVLAYFAVNGWFAYTARAR